MRVRYAHICDYYLQSDDGKPSLLGIFNRVWSYRFPFRMSRPCTIVVCVCLENEDAGQTVQCQVQLRDPEMIALMTFDVEIPLGADPRASDMNLKFEVVQGLMFTTPGPHVIEVRLNGDLQESIDLAVVKMEKSG